MCRFLSAIVTRDGRVLHHEATDSHEALIGHFGLRDTTDHDYAMQHFCRVEFVPDQDRDGRPFIYGPAKEPGRAPDHFNATYRECLRCGIRRR